MPSAARRSIAACLAVLLGCVLAGAEAHAQIRRDDISPFPSDAWFDTGHTTPAGDSAGPDLTAIHVEYKNPPLSRCGNLLLG